jgi:CO/xanthine dehydrogenase FAD-binding subunit
MKPSAFEYLRPASLDGVRSALTSYGDDAKLLAGGQSLVPLMNFRLARPEYLVDLNGIPELSYINCGTDGTLRIGSMTRVGQIERANGALAGHPLLKEAAQLVGHFQIRNRGTVGGSVAHADPAAEFPTALLTLDATVEISSSRGTRIVKAGDLFLGPFTTVLEPDEVLTEIRFPALPPNSGSAITEFARRPGDFAIAGAACRITSDGDRVRDIRLCLLGVATTPIRLETAEEILRGEALTASAVTEAVETAMEDISAMSDLHGSESYRKALAVEMAVSAATVAAGRAGEGGTEG